MLYIHTYVYIYVCVYMYIDYALSYIMCIYVLSDIIMIIIIKIIYYNIQILSEGGGPGFNPHHIKLSGLEVRPFKVSGGSPVHLRSKHRATGPGN